jgi:hypothetical protein
MLVAVNVHPIKREAKKELLKKKELIQKLKAKGIKTPPIATDKDLQPAADSLPISVSIPTSKSSKMIPIWARRWIEGVSSMNPSTLGPIKIPARSSPMTEGI